MSEDECDHEWVFIRTDEDWFDGDETDVYECKKCKTKTWKYIGR